MFFFKCTKETENSYSAVKNVCIYVIKVRKGRQLQLVKNVAARMLIKTKAEHITPILDSQHWLSVCQRKGF